MTNPPKVSEPDIAGRAFKRISADEANNPSLAYEMTHKLICDISTDRYGRPLVAALHLCLELEEKLSTLTYTGDGSPPPAAVAARINEKRSKLRDWAMSLSIHPGDVTISAERKKEIAWDLAMVLSQNPADGCREQAQHWRDDALEAAAGIVDAYHADTWISRDIRAMKSKAPMDGCREALKDAERYRYLRQCDWESAPLCVVVSPKVCVKLGSDCPSRERLDEAVDAALSDDSSWRTRD